MSYRVSENVNPTHDEVREWGFDEDLAFIDQDEDIILSCLSYVPVLLELAQNLSCPKQHYALCIVGQFAREAALHRISNDLHGLEQIVNSFQASEPSVEDWQNYVNRLLSYQQHPFAVDEQKAWVMAQDLFLGIGRKGNISMDEDIDSHAWHFSLVIISHDHLSIIKQNGTYSYWRT